jgi:hypothetical protein
MGEGLIEGCKIIAVSSYWLSFETLDNLNFILEL